MVISGVRRRGSGGWFGGNAGGAVQKCGGLWRTCGMLVLQWNFAVFAGDGVEIFCSTWNILRCGLALARSLWMGYRRDRWRMCWGEGDAGSSVGFRGAVDVPRGTSTLYLGGEGTTGSS